MNPLVRCPHCGHYHQATLEYCPDTGLPIYITTKPEPQKDNRKVLIGLAIAAGVMALIACILLSIFVLPRFLSGNFSPGEQAPVIVPSLTLAPLETRFAENNTPIPTVTEEPMSEATSTSELPESSATPGVWDACPGYDYLSQLRIGMQAQIALEPALPNRVREQPSTSAAIAGYIDPGGKVEILEGPACAEGWIWWKVREIDSNLEGWTAEGDVNGYWVIPIP